MNRLKSKFGNPKEEDNTNYIEEVNGTQGSQLTDTRERTFQTFRSRDTVPNYLVELDPTGNANKRVKYEETQRLEGDAKKYLEQESYTKSLNISKDQGSINQSALPTLAEIMHKRHMEMIRQRKESKLRALEKLYGVHTNQKNNSITDMTNKKDILDKESELIDLEDISNSEKE